VITASRTRVVIGLAHHHLFNLIIILTSEFDLNVIFTCYIMSIFFDIFLLLLLLLLVLILLLSLTLLLLDYYYCYYYYLYTF